MIKITSDFDHGNIVVQDATDLSDIRLGIKPDGAAKFHQWFYYKVETRSGEALVMNIVNAGSASYVEGWKDYRAVASYDGEQWFRVNTNYTDDVLTIRHAPERDVVYYAYFAAYPTTRHRSFIERIKSENAFSHSRLGETLDGQTIDYFQAGEGTLQYWVIARQHPGEDMGSWWMEGFLHALADEADEAATALKKAATVHIVPCMNLDGVARGHLRTNAAGVDLNRAWRNTTMDKSPEVFLVRNAMKKTGVDFFLDVHGDEAIPNNFLDPGWGTPSWTDESDSRFERYRSLMLEISKDFQTKDGYPKTAPGKANLDIATNYVTEEWRCLAMTLEMPFKDANVNPDPEQGWSPERCRAFAREHLQAMARIAPQLR
ncbi:MAG: M14-type cytosolic carboxypeptidase [Pseudomonadota bacterium]